MSQTTSSISQSASTMATGGAVGTSAVAFLNENAAVISLSIAAASLVLALTFHLLNYALNRKRTSDALRDREELVLERVAMAARKAGETEEQISFIIEKAKQD